MGTKLKQRGSPPSLLSSEKFFVSNTLSHRKASSFASAQKKDWRRASSRGVWQGSGYEIQRDVITVLYTTLNLLQRTRLPKRTKPALECVFFTCESLSVMSDSLWPHVLYSPWNPPGQNTGVGSHSFLQGIFPTQGLNPGRPHCRWILYQVSHQGSPRILEWVTYPFSRGSSQSRDQTGVSCIAGRFFTNWALELKQTTAQPTPQLDNWETLTPNLPINQNKTWSSK